MAEFQSKPNTGAIFVNKNKKSENYPDMRGDVSVDRNLLIDLLSKHKDGPIKLAVSAWKKNSKAGDSFLSLSVGEPFEKKAEANPWEQ